MTTPIYDAQTWTDGEVGNTPLSAARLVHIEAGIHNASLTANAAAALLPPTGTDTLGLLTSFVAPFSAVQGYREPTGTELTNALAGLGKLPFSSTDATTVLTPLGFTVVTGIDAVTKRPFALAYSAAPTDLRGWGFYLFDLSAPINSVIAVPHPIAEQNTELLGHAHWQSRPGRLLVVAGAHRDSASGLADVSTHTASLFHNVCASYASRKLVQCHWQGYADAAAAGLTHIVGTGPAVAGAAALRVGTELKAAGYTIGQGWDSSGSGTGLIAATNVQAIDAAAKQAAFINIEVNNTTRQDTAARTRTAAAAVAAEIGTLANADGGLPARAGTDFPQQVGSANTVGTSAYFARADHIHKDNPTTIARIVAVEGRSVPQPADFGYVAWATDPAGIATAVTPTAGVLYLWKIPIRTAGQLISALHLGVSVVGSGLTASQCFMALFDPSTGTRLGITADLSGALGTVGETTHNLTAGATIATAGFVYAGLLLNGTTMPQLARGGPNISGLGNAKTTASSKRIAQYGSAQTAMPSSITLASMVNTANAPWMALS
jgi:hypothetical protein